MARLSTVLNFYLHFNIIIHIFSELSTGPLPLGFPTRLYTCIHDHIVTGYGLEGPGIESRWGQDFPPWDPPSLLYNEYRVFTGGTKRPGRDANPSPLIVLSLKTEYSYTSTLSKDLRGL
jgi:hypothetical protein